MAVAHDRVLAKSCLLIAQVSIHTALKQDSGLRQASDRTQGLDAGRTQSGFRTQTESVSSHDMSWWKVLSLPSVQ